MASDDKTTEPVEGSWSPRRPRTAAEQRAKPPVADKASAKPRAAAPVPEKVTPAPEQSPPVVEPVGSELPPYRPLPLPPVEPSRVPMLVGAGVGLAVLLLLLRRWRRR